MADGTHQTIRAAFTGGVDLGFARDLTLRLNVVRKHDWGGNMELDLAMPFETFTDLRSVVDPGRDKIAGTADDGVLEVWSVPRTYPTFGQVNRFFTNTAPGEGEDWVKLVDMRLAKTFRFGKHSFEGMFDLFNATNSVACEVEVLGMA